MRRSGAWWCIDRKSVRDHRWSQGFAIRLSGDVVDGADGDRAVVVVAVVVTVGVVWWLWYDGWSMMSLENE